MRKSSDRSLSVRTEAGARRAVPVLLQARELVILLVRVMVLVLLTLTGPAGSAHAAGRAETQPSSPPGQDFALQVLALINAYRTSLGLTTLQADPALQPIAEASSREQAAAGRLSHSGFSKRFAQANRSTCVENLAAGLLQPEALVAAWQASPAHRHSLVAPAIRYAGLANVNGYVTFFACD